MNALLNYPGAKWGMAKEIVALMPPHRSYLEPFFGSGEYALWCDGDEIYGLLKDRNQSEIKTADWMLPIKMSEYYAAIERSESRQKVVEN